MKNHAERKHAKFAPSASDKWLNCFGFVQMAAKAPPQRTHPSAAEGTEAHQCLEFIARKGPVMGLLRAREVALKKWPEAMVYHALKAWDTIWELAPSSSGAELLIERRVRLSADVYGSLDYAWLEPWGELVIMDYKYGKHVVLPKDPETGEENTQLLCYGTALAKEHAFEFDTVKLAIIQPRAWDESESALTVAETKIKTLRQFEKRVEHAVTEAKKPNPKLVYGEEHCRWCPAKSFCPAYEAGQNNPENSPFDTEPSPIHKT